MTAKRDADTESPISAARASKRAKLDPVKMANAMSLATFEERFIEHIDLMHSVRQKESKTVFLISHYDAATLPRRDFQACFDLIKITSMTDYKASSMGWKPNRKKREMTDPLMHYLLVQRQDEAEDTTTSPTIAGFMSFMLTYDSQPCVPVLYVYEVHLAERARGTGLGARLLAICEEIAQTVGVPKVMLTCFLSNSNAHQFYIHHGYDRDPVSPEDRLTRNTIVKADYVIMGKDVVSSDVKDTNKQSLQISSGHQ